MDVLRENIGLLQLPYEDEYYYDEANDLDYLNEIGDTRRGQEMIDRMAARHRQRLHVIGNSYDYNIPTSLKLREKQHNMWQNSMKHLTRAYNRRSYFSDINRRSPQDIAFMRKHFKMNGYK